jgi:hypothetical protein
VAKFIASTTVKMVTSTVTTIVQVMRFLLQRVIGIPSMAGTFAVADRKGREALP